jgi:threonine aldolase
LIDLILKDRENYGNEHQVQAKVLSLTQSTERGTVYQLKELESLKVFAKGKGMKVFMDGARFANATASLGVSPRKIVEAAGLDILSLGGTKNGMMLGELVLVFNPEIAAEMKFYRKQVMQLSSKMRYISAQFLAYFENDLWLENATHANAMAKKLAEKLSGMENVVLSENVEANSVFVKIPKNCISPLQEEYPFYVWDEEINEVRWMCSFDTTEDEINRFVKRVKEVVS